MDLFYWLIISVVVFITSLASYQDIKHRKVSNKITLFFIGFTFALFIFFIPYSSNIVLSLIIVILMFVGSYILYKTGRWGGADGKIFISSVLLILVFKGVKGYSNYLVNLLFIYSLFITLAVLILTSIKDKMNVVKNTDWKYVLFSAIFVYSILKLLAYFFISIVSPQISFILVLLTLVMVIFLAPYLRSLYKIRYGSYILFILVVALFSFSLYFYGVIYLYFLPLLLLLRVLLILVSSLTTSIGKSEKAYYSPFVVFILLTLIYTLVTDKGFIWLLKIFF